MKSELKTASNIKNRKNRGNVERCLRTIIERLKIEKQENNVNGMFVFSGITRDGFEVLEILTPKIPSSLSYYRCDNKFHTWIITDYLRNDDRGILLCLIYGDYCMLYECGVNRLKKLYSHDNRLVKRQRKGGQSSVRFSRLAEESRKYYVESVKDRIHEIVLEKMLPIVIDGGTELSQDLYLVLKENVKVLRTTVFSDIGKDEKCEELLRKEIKYLNGVIERIYDDSEEKINKICDDFLYRSELYVVGLEEIKENWNNLEVVLMLKEKDFEIEKEKLIVGIGSSKYGFLKELGGIIGKKWY